MLVHLLVLLVLPLHLGEGLLVNAGLVGQEPVELVQQLAVGGQVLVAQVADQISDFGLEFGHAFVAAEFAEVDVLDGW